MQAQDSPTSPPRLITDKWCPRCRYHLKGLPLLPHTTCPECGGRFETDRLLTRPGGAGDRAERVAFGAGRIITIGVLVIILAALAVFILGALGRVLFELNG